MAYPLPVFHFQVDWGSTSFAFSEVTGLNIEVQAIEYRDGTEKSYSMQKMPGIKKYGNITLKRGVTSKSNEFFEWYETTKLNTTERRDVVISLLNEDHEPTMVWSVRNAWITKLTAPDMKASGNEVAIEQIELAHEGFVVANS